MESVETIHPAPNFASGLGLLEIADQPALRTCRRRRCRLRFGLFFLFCYSGAEASAIGGYACLPHAGDIACSQDVARRIAIHQQQIRALAGRDRASIVQMENAGGHGRRGRQGLGRRQSGLHQQFQLAMLGCARSGSGIRHVITHQNWHASGLQLLYGFE